MGALPIDIEKAVKTMFMLDTVRGIDSAGVITVNAGGMARVAKALGTPADLYRTKEWRDAYAGTLNLMACHNRAATMGRVIPDNAHPFITDTLIGMHNGTLRNTYKLDDDLMYDTDSEALFNHISAHGLDDTLKIVNGAYTLVWYDKEKNTINFVRNKERPLHYAFTSDMKTMLWASEEWMIDVACKRHKVNRYQISELEPHHHLALNIPKGFTNNCPKYEKMDLREVPKYVAPPSTGKGRYTGSYSGYGGYNEDDYATYLRDRRRGSNKAANNGGNTNNRGTNVYSGAGAAPAATVADLSRYTKTTIAGKTTFPITEGGEFYLRLCMFIGNKIGEIRVYAPRASQLAETFRKEGAGVWYNLYIKKVSRDQKTNRPYLLGKVKTMYKLSNPPKEMDNSSKGVAAEAVKKASEESKDSSNEKSSSKDIIPVEDAYAFANEDGSTFERIDNKDDLRDCYYNVFNGVLVTGDELLERGSNGCAMCSDPPSLIFADEYEWFSSREYFCGDCKDTQFAMDWLYGKPDASNEGDE